MGDSDGVWGLSEHLTALAVDELRIANWQRENEGRKESKQTRRPKPVPRPGTQRDFDRNSPQRRAKHAAARERAAARRAAIARGEIR